MKKFVELPLVEPMYSTYQYQGPATATLVKNPTIRNWYLNEIIMLSCSRRFLTGFTTPELNVVNSAWHQSPHMERIWHNMKYLNGYVNPLIRNLLDAGYYICFNNIDDYYIKGKTFYKERHFLHDGMICGYNCEDKTYCIYSYDSKWIYQKFWTPQKCFDRARMSAFEKGKFGDICATKPGGGKVNLTPAIAIKNIEEYLNSDYKKYPEDGEGNVLGIVVHYYIAKYVGKLYDGSIPYERMDRRVFRLIWEHKKVMLERIFNVERVLYLPHSISEKYKAVVAEADMIRMLYASHHMRRRDSVLLVIQKKLIELCKNEEILLNELLFQAEGVKKSGTVEYYKE